MRIDFPIPRSKPFDVVGVGINVIDYLFRISHFPEPDTKMDALSAMIQAAGFAVNVVDTTGAGDVFHGAFLYGFLQGWEAGDILRFANAVSALKCTCLGGRTGIPRLEEARRFLDACG